MAGLTAPPPGSAAPGATDGAGQWTSIAFVLMLVLVIAAPTMTGGGDFSGGGNAVRQAGYTLVFGMLVVATLREDGLILALRTSLPCNLLLVYCWLSLVWAINPDVGFRRLMLTTIVIYSVFIVVRTLGAAASLAVMERVLLVVLTLNFVAVVVLPGIGVHQYVPGGDPGIVGDWRGILGEKNIAGSITAVTLLALVLGPQPRSGAVGFGLVAASFFFLVQTGSRTALGLCLVALAVGLGVRRYDLRSWPFAMAGVALLAIAVALSVAAFWDRLTAMLDQQDAFTGRPQIWSVLLSYAQDNWIFGSGYGSFWNIGADSPIYTYAKQGSWLTTRVATAHNGFLDLAVQIGAPGLLLAVFALFVHPLARLLTNPALEGNRPILAAVLVFCVAQNMTESTMLDRDYFVQVCLMWSIAGILARDARAAAPAPAVPSAHRTSTHSEASKARNGAGAQSDGFPYKKPEPM